MIPPGLWAAFSMVGCVLSCLSDAMRTGMCLIFALSIANNWKQTRTNANKITMILYKMKQTQTVVSQLAHSFNQRARDSSSLERTKIPRRIVRFFVGFSFFWGSAHFCTPAGKPCFSLHCLPYWSFHSPERPGGRAFFCSLSVRCTAAL